MEKAKEKDAKPRKIENKKNVNRTDCSDATLVKQNMKRCARTPLNCVDDLKTSD